MSTEIDCVAAKRSQRPAGLTVSTMTISEIKRHYRRVVGSAVFFGVFATGIRVGANLLLLPLLLRKLPTAELALWWVFSALGGLANLADFGFGPSISRVYSVLWAGAEDFEAEGLRPPTKTREPNLPKIRQLSATVAHFYWRLATGAVLFLMVVGVFVLWRPASRASAPTMVWLAWLAYLLSIGYSLGTSRWLLACQGLGRVREMQAAYTWSSMAYVICTAGLLLAGWGLLALAVSSALRGFIAREYCRKVYFNTVPRLAAPESTMDLTMLKRLWPNAYKMGLIAIGAFLLSNAGVLISSSFLGDKITASFGLTAQIGTFIMSFAGLWLAVKWPTLTVLRAQGRLEEMSCLFARRLALTMGSFVLLASMVVLFGDRLLALKGSHTRLLPAKPLIFYFAYLAQQLFYVQFGSLAYTENVVPFFKIAISTGVGMLALSLILTWAFGLWGLLVAPLIAECVCSTWFTIRRGFQGQPLSARQLMRAALTLP